MSGIPAQSPGPRPLHVLQLLGSGGAGTGEHVRSLAAGLVARGVKVTVCAPATAERHYRFADVGARFAELPADSRTRAAWRAHTLAARADLVHAHGLRAGAVAALATRARPVPLVLTWHVRRDAYGPTAPLRDATEAMVARASSVVLGATTDLVDRARRRGARDARLAPVGLPGSRTPSADAPGSRSARRELGLGESPLLLATATLEPGQGHETLLSAAGHWRDRGAPPLLALVGDGPLRTDLERRVTREQLPVRLLGDRRDGRRLLAAADIAVSAGGWDGRGLAAQEALRVGVPLVAAGVGGMPRLVGDAAVLVPAAEPRALADAVTGLLADPDRRAALSAAGRSRAESWPTEDHTVAHVLSVYDEFA
ncbi:glycosyltransferase family 4 protein [Streptomyces bohaiensis]|uniref:glycosyltransferase family 4 protein n=1 Tax=Streptomyces bohaiensis TaxID=1431344 RepID=UPI003B7CD2C9